MKTHLVGRGDLLHVEGQFLLGHDGMDQPLQLLSPSLKPGQQIIGFLW
jgi:hypothetical protein